MIIPKGEVIMMVNDLLFQTHLSYQIQTQEQEEDSAEITLEDVKDIDLHRCRYRDFHKAMEYLLNTQSDISFSETSIQAVKPADFSEERKYDFVELTDFAKHQAVTIGNMALFSDLQKIASATEQFNYSIASPHEKHAANVFSFADYDNYIVKDQPLITEELGSCVIGGGNAEAIKLTATFHESSTAERPIISIRAFSLSNNTYMDNSDIVDLNTVFLPNASLMEVFAYMSYTDNKNGLFNQSFDRLMASGLFEVDSLEDMYSHHYDLRTFDLNN